MGSSASKNEEERKPQINIIEDKDKEKDINNRENERVIPGNPIYLNTDNHRTIKR